MTNVKSESEITGMRVAGRLAAEVLEMVEPLVIEGITTAELDDLVHDFIVYQQNAVPAPLNYGGIIGGALSFHYVTHSFCTVAHTGTHLVLEALRFILPASIMPPHFGIPLCGFPKSVCISINEEVCHGIPGPGKLAVGDIVNVDVTVIFDGFHGDTSMMIIVPPARDASTSVPPAPTAANTAVGSDDASLPPVTLGSRLPIEGAVVEPSLNDSSPNTSTSLVGDMEERQRLVDVARDCLWLGISMVRPGVTLGELGDAIQRLANRQGYSVVREYGGHGIGRWFHEAPFVSHVSPAASSGSSDTVLQPGMTFTIEPMLNAGGADVQMSFDQWTVVTADGALSAQWEHTLLVTKHGVEVLTLRSGEIHPRMKHMQL